MSGQLRRAAEREEGDATDVQSATSCGERMTEFVSEDGQDQDHAADDGEGQRGRGREAQPEPAGEHPGEERDE